MNAWTHDRGYGLDERRRRQAAQHLKRCPLCGTLNVRDSHECVTCRWHGEFESDPFEIEAGLLAILDRCPEIRPASPKRNVSRPKFLSDRLWVFDLVQRLAERWTRNRRLDFRA